MLSLVSPVPCRIPFVLQGSNGVAGEDTFLISNENDFMSALNKVSNEFKVSRYISNNIPVSVHMCITDEEYCLKGPFLQIIGFPELSFSKFQYLGSDTNQSLFDNFFIKKVREMSIALAEYSKNKGYRGIMGIDYLWDKESGVVYPQELNTRFVAPTRLITGIQKEQNIIPDVLKHIGQFVQNVEALKKNDFKEGEIDLNEKNYSQLYIANNLTSDVTVVNYLEPGVYIIDQGKLIKTKSSLFLKDVEKDEILITYTAYLGSILVSGGIIAKIILKKSILNTGKYELNVESKSLIKIIKDNIIKK